MSLPFDITYNDKAKQDINSSLCEAVDCSFKATEKIDISAGKFGTISLYLCSKCIGIFQKQKKNDDFSIR